METTHTVLEASVPSEAAIDGRAILAMVPSSTTTTIVSRRTATAIYRRGTGRPSGAELGAELSDIRVCQ